MSASPNAIMPVFSYAQAAKGLAPSKSSEVSVKDESPEQSSKSSQKSETSSNAPSRASRSRPRTEEKEQTSSKESVSGPAVPERTPDKENVPPTRRTQQPSEASRASTSATTSPQPTAALGSPKDKDFLTRGDRTDSWEKTSELSNSHDKATQSDKDKIKESEDDWEKISIPSTTAEKELKAAPPPAVNFWAARMEAQQAKRKELAAQRTPAPVNNAPAGARPKSHGEDSKRKPGSRDLPGKDAPSSFRKSNDTQSAQLSRPTSQQGDKMTGNPPPPVDNVSWPTPENAIVDDRRKSSSQDKSEKLDSRVNGAKSHGNKWVSIPFVPTAKFETPLPGIAAKRGGRGGRGRDGQTRGAHTGAGGERQEAGAMGPPPVPNKTGDQDRGRRSEGQRGSRSSSLPPNNRRAPSRDSMLANLRKPATPMKGNVHSGSPAASNISEGENLGGQAQATSSKDQSRSSSRHDGLETGQASYSDVFTSQAITGKATDTFAYSATEVNARLPYSQERAKMSHPTYRTSADPSRDRTRPRNPEWSHDKSDAAREKVESWRDRDLSGESTGRREPRSDRGRGGYRGRGNQSYNSHPGSHAYTSPLPQNGFEPTRPSSNAEPRSRQSSQPYTMPTPPNSNRNNPRSHSIPIGMMFPPGYYPNIPGMPPALSPIQTDMSGYVYPQQIPIDQGIMSAMPYSNSLNSYAIMSMVVGQIEYYFSIDNLCKDMFLRKNMDSQGWVPLQVVANFKRIKALTEENFPIDMMRHVCSQVRNIEHLPLPNGEDKLRSRENWRDFVLPMNERFEAAQNDGPAVSAAASQQLPRMPQPSHEGLPATSPPLHSPPAGLASVNGMYETTSPATFTTIPPLDGASMDRNFTSPVPQQAQEPVRRDAITSPQTHESMVFRPMPPSQKFNGMVNGHRRQPSRNFNEENLFPDEEIADINICVRQPPVDGAHDASSMPKPTRVLSNESLGSGSDVAPVGVPSRVSGLRGGGHEQFGAGLKGMVFGSSNGYAGSSIDAPAFFTKEGEQSQLRPLNPGEYWTPYLSLREDSLHHRKQGVDGAMETLYNFWSSFLVDKFNAGMYQDFKTLAIDDLSSGSEDGVQYLMKYYQKALKGSRPLSDAVASDLVSFLRDEADGKDRVFKMMRIAWRDGALNLKTRKRIGDHLSDEEKAGFDKGG